ncbi:MAG: hypothetical protein US92_C0011G0019 [Candidatus Peregrinibacteria bacterium GW2011_GWA2_38_36]|nr:MAG: hypothetical protein US92_C0011G0019 [Candidatus Peregrinibacteria bacterium GW2011_GWA2_38_36]
MLKKTLYIIGVGTVLFFVWKYGQEYIMNPNAVFSEVGTLKNNLYTSVQNVKKEGEARIEQIKEIKTKVDDKVNKLNNAVDAVKELTK